MLLVIVALYSRPQQRNTTRVYLFKKTHLISISISMIRNTTQNDDFLASTDQWSSHAKLKYDANGILWLVLNYYPKGFISQFHLNVIAQSERASVGWGRCSRWLKLLKYSLSFWGVITGTLFQIPKRPHITWHVRIYRIQTWSLFFGGKLENVIMEMVLKSWTKVIQILQEGHSLPGILSSGHNMLWKRKLNQCCWLSRQRVCSILC